MRTASLALSGSLLLSVAVALVSACSSSTAPGLATNPKDAGSSGSSGAAEPDARNPYPSFKGDVVPIIQMSCALTACHASKESNLGIFLAYDPVQLYAELKKTSPTAVGAPFVVPGDPSTSYVILKLEGMQATEMAKCANGPTMTCGTVMPPDAPLPETTIKVFKDWIMAGAKDD